MADYSELVLEKICRTCEFGNLPTIPFCVECGDSLTYLPNGTHRSRSEDRLHGLQGGDWGGYIALPGL